jgi:hypothetical protein
MKIINPRVTLINAKTENQCCVYCGEFLKYNQLVISLSNKGDKLTIKKNIMLHIHCLTPFYNSITEFINENKSEIIVKSL